MLRSLRRRVPVFVFGLAVVILVTPLLATRQEIESTLLRAGRGRASAAARQIAEAHMTR